MSTTAADEDRGGRGVSLVKGPVGLIGAAGLVYGISALIFGAHGFDLHFPHGAVHGKTWLRLEVNGYSSLLFIAAGLLLILAAPAHWAAKGASLLTALGLGAAAVVAAVRGDGIFGIFAANHATEIVWGAGAVLLFGLSLLPRVGGRRVGRRRATPVAATEVAGGGAPTTARDREPDEDSGRPTRARITKHDDTRMKEGADD